ncbi:MAG: hypothetical protein AB8H79_06215 [Myxococcota bacterium]
MRRYKPVIWRVVPMVLGLLIAAPAARADDTDAGLRHGLVDGEPVFKWSAPPLDEGGWVIGLGTVAYGITDEVTVSVRSSELVLGHYNGHVRAGLGTQEQPKVSVEGGVGVLTPVALARLFVPAWETRSLVLSSELAVAMTWTQGDTRFLTVRPWFALAAGRVEDDDEQLTLLLGRPVLTGPGISALAETHISKNLGLVGSLDLGLELYGFEPGVAVRPRGAAVLATGPLRVNLGLGVGVYVDNDGALRSDLQPALDIWVRF